MIDRLVSAAAVALLVSGAALAQSPSPTPPSAKPPTTASNPAAPAGGSGVMTSLPADATTVANFYKQSVYDPSDKKLGEVSDLLVQKDGKVVVAMIGVGGLLGVGEKTVAIPFEAMRVTNKDNKTYLVISTTQDALKAAPGFKYDRNKTTWVPDTESSTTGMGGAKK